MAFVWCRMDLWSEMSENTEKHPQSSVICVTVQKNNLGSNIVYSKDMEVIAYKIVMRPSAMMCFDCNLNVCKYIHITVLNRI